MHEFGSSGVRGVANEELTPADVLGIAQAAGTVLAPPRAAIARDTRRTGKLFADAAASGLASVGIDVDRLGELPTPGLQAYCEREEMPGVMITASHNPPAYNGVKLVGEDGVELDRDTLAQVETTITMSAAAPVGWDGVGQSRTVEGAADDYVDAVLSAADRETIADASLTVVVDPGHGAGAHTSPQFFRELGCTVHTVHGQPDGHFPGRDPEPVAENLGDLCTHVQATDADLGVAHDGDADRAVFVDETGSVINGDAALAALVEANVSAGDTIVSAVNASQRLVDVVERADASLSLTPIGSTNIITRITDLQSQGESVPVAGEGNGGVLFPGYRIARDGAYTGAVFCELVAAEPASAIAARFDDYVNVREAVTYADDAERAAMLEAVEATARDANAALDTTDGFRLDYGDGWVLARPSGTEPVIRIYAEARDRDRAAALAARFEDAVRDADGAGE
jgi:phosphomannomutase/phosphoglucomutase